jgi:uncharacterized protein (DUF58 family)
VKTGFLHGRFERWLANRLPQCDHTTLTQRNVFILPTQVGLMLAATLLVLLVASINYQLNLGYLLTFLLAGCALASMPVSHATLRGLELNLVTPEPVFAGNSAAINVTLQNQRRSGRFGIGLAVANSKQWVWTDVPAQGSITVQVAFKPVYRGLQRLPTLTLETRFPLGTFRVWTLWRPDARVLVYPTPEFSAPPLPPGEPNASGAAETKARNSGDFDGVRAYRRGDPLKLIVWKKAVKTDQLISRETEQVQGLELWLDQRQTGATEPELQLSRLCAWVLQADKLSLNYGLRLATLEIKPGSGQEHKQRCLEALALC